MYAMEPRDEYFANGVPICRWDSNKKCFSFRVLLVIFRFVNKRDYITTGRRPNTIVCVKYSLLANRMS